MTVKIYIIMSQVQNVMMTQNDSCTPISLKRQLYMKTYYGTLVGFIIKNVMTSTGGVYEFPVKSYRKIELIK